MRGITALGRARYVVREDSSLPPGKTCPFLVPCLVHFWMISGRVLVLSGLSASDLFCWIASYFCEGCENDERKALEVQSVLRELELLMAAGKSTQHSLSISDP